MSESCLVCFQSGACDLEGAIESLKGYSFNVVRRGEELIISRGEGLQFKIILDSADHVLEEAIEFSEGSEFSSRMSNCNARFEIIFEDLDTA